MDTESLENARSLALVSVRGQVSWLSEPEVWARPLLADREQQTEAKHGFARCVTYAAPSGFAKEDKLLLVNEFSSLRTKL